MSLADILEKRFGVELSLWTG
jgi:hypothetical protein